MSTEKRVKKQPFRQVFPFDDCKRQLVSSPATTQKARRHFEFPKTVMHPKLRDRWKIERSLIISDSPRPVVCARWYSPLGLVDGFGVFCVAQGFHSLLTRWFRRMSGICCVALVENVKIDNQDEGRQC